MLGDLVDGLLSQLPPLETARPWRVQVENLALAPHRVLVARPGSVRVFAEGPHTPASTERVERLVGLLLSHDLAPGLAATTIQAVLGLVSGWATQAPYGSDLEEHYWQGLPEAAMLVEHFPALARCRTSGLAEPEQQLSRALELLPSGVPDRSPFGPGPVVPRNLDGPVPAEEDDDDLPVSSKSVTL
ncbi:TetR/AcrR family transcriptional regulator C-terminal domain-containing protein [Cryobacterium sp. CAN_C2]|uniref:TetR/AcrR family transcriptional regulator C-terminal domain-containing protein n=1 Tax=Cryobacterium sp. CAN_C2 TaxID=2787723 RepID=UPI002FEE9B07